MVGGCGGAQMTNMVLLLLLSDCVSHNWRRDETEEGLRREEGSVTQQKISLTRDFFFFFF